jgi:RNA polymerase sigma factor (sigma-70 family)
MVDAYLRNVIRTLRRVAPQGTDQPSDSQYLDRFVRQRDEAAFEVLVWRHGPRVWNVCRRVLAREADVEDAFQATFLTLVRKAGTISNGESLGSWLHKVALRNALASRATGARRALTNGDDFAWHAEGQPEERGWSEARPLLADEVNQLPPKYRLPVELCYMQGKTLNEAARDLGCGKGTLGSRLARARKRLRGRLARRGALPSLNRQTDILLREPQQVSAAPPTPSPAAVQVAARSSESVGRLPQAGWPPSNCHAGTEPLPLVVDTANCVEIDASALCALSKEMPAGPIVAVRAPELVMPPGRHIVAAGIETTEQCFVGIDWARYPGIYRATTADIDLKVARFMREIGCKTSGRCTWCAAPMELRWLRENQSGGMCRCCWRKMLARLGRRAGGQAILLAAGGSGKPWGRPAGLPRRLPGDGDTIFHPLQCHEGMSDVLLRSGEG